MLIPRHRSERTLTPASRSSAVRRASVNPARWRRLAGIGLATVTLTTPSPAVEPAPTNSVEQLEQRLQGLRQDFERVQSEQRRQIEALEEQIKTLRAAPKPPETALADPTPPSPPAPTPEAKPWSPSDPIRFGGPRSYVDLGLVGTFAAGGSTASDIDGGTQAGGHDPNQRGFSVQGVELSLTGAVDPYFRGNVNLLYSLDAEGESFLELEEGWLETVALPGNFQVRAGQIYTEFGRHNSTHLHAWHFVDTPVVNARFLGPDGLRNPGARVAWLLPTPFFAEFLVGVQDSHGETAASFRSSGHSHGAGADSDELPLAYRHADNDRGVHHVDDLLLSPRVTFSIELAPDHVLLAGLSGAFGPNSRGGPDGGSTRTEVYGADVTWKWQSPTHRGGFPFVQWQTEGLWRRYDAGAFDWTGEPDPIIDAATGLAAFLPGESLDDRGFYTQILYGFRKGWVAGLRLDYAGGQTADYERTPLLYRGEPLGEDPQRAERWRLSPNLTWYPSEFSKIRLQYNYDDRQGFGSDHSVWLQFEFLLGAHAAHKF